LTKIEVELIVTTREKKIVIIELPIYKHITSDYSTIYTRINEDLSAVHIHKSMRPWDNGYGFEIWFEDRHIFDGSAEDYRLGKGIYSLSEGEFLEVLAELKRSIETM